MNRSLLGYSTDNVGSIIENFFPLIKKYFVIPDDDTCITDYLATSPHTTIDSAISTIPEACYHLIGKLPENECIYDLTLLFLATKNINIYYYSSTDYYDDVDSNYQNATNLKPYILVSAGKGLYITNNLLSNHFKTEYLKGIPNISNSEQLPTYLEYLYRIQDNIINYETETAATGAVLSVPQYGYSKPNQNVLNSLVPNVINLFKIYCKEYSMIFSTPLIFENSTKEREIYNLIDNKIDEILPIFQDELLKMFNNFNITDKTADITTFSVPTGIIKLRTTAGWQYMGDVMLFYKVYADIANLLTIYFSINITRDLFYDIYNLRIVEMPLGYTKGDTITIPNDIYKSENIKSEPVKEPVNDKDKDKDKNSFNYLFLLIPIIILIIIGISIYYYIIKK